MSVIPEYGDGGFTIAYGEVGVGSMGGDSWSKTETLVRPPQAECVTPCLEGSSSLTGAHLMVEPDVFFFFKAGEEKSYFISSVFLTCFQMRLWVCISDGRFYRKKFS